MTNLKQLVDLTQVSADIVKEGQLCGVAELFVINAAEWVNCCDLAKLSELDEELLNFRKHFGYLVDKGSDDRELIFYTLLDIISTDDQEVLKVIS